MFTDAYDVIVNGDAETIARRFLDEFAESRLVFGAEPFCWPDKSLANKYPQVRSRSLIRLYVFRSRLENDISTLAA